MLRTNRVLIIDDDYTDLEESLLADFRDLGVDAEMCTTRLATELLGDTKLPDAVIIRFPLNGSDEPCSNVRTFVGNFRQAQNAAGIPVISVGRTETTDDPDGDHLFDINLAGPVSAYQLIGRISAHGRIEAMQRELNLRDTIAKSFGCSLPDIALPPTQVMDANILYVGDPINYLAIQSLLPKATDLVGSFSPTMAEDYLDQRQFDLVLLNYDPVFAEDIIAGWRRNPHLASLPVVPVLNDIETDSSTALFRAGASDILIRPITSDAIASRIDPLVRENRIRASMTLVYPQTHPQQIADPTTGLYGKPFLERYLDKVLTRSSLKNDPMWLVGIRFEPLAERRAANAALPGPEFCATIGQMIRNLIRCEDLAACVSGNQVIVAMRSRNRLDASILARRLSAVIGMTPLSGGVENGPRYADLDVHFIKAAPDMDAESAIAAVFDRETVL